MANETIRIDSVTATGVNIPEVGVDATSGGVYIAWELNDEGAFNFQVSDLYQAGTEIELAFEESSSGVSLNHKWQFTVTVLRPSTSSTDAATWQDVLTEQYTSSSAANRLLSRSVYLTTDGEIDSQAVAAGDIITVVWTRIAASANEDAAVIRVFNVDVTQTLETAGAGAGTCLGRVGEIIEDVRALFNDDGGGFIENDSEILQWINRCQMEIAKTGLFRKTGYLNIVSGAQSYDLLSGLSDFVDLNGLRLSGTNRPISSVSNRADWNLLNTPPASGTVPYWYFAESNKLYLWPTPTSGITSGLAVEYSYLPTDLGCTSGYTPDLPQAYDMVFTNYALAQAFKRDRHAPGADQKYEVYSQLYQQSLQDLVTQAGPPSTTGSCSGRLGTILLRARIKLNQAGMADLSDYDLLTYLDEVTEDLAEDDYFRAVSTYSGVSGQATYNLSTIQGTGSYTIERLFNVAYKGSDSVTRPLQPLTSWHSYSQLTEDSSGITGDPLYWFTDGTTLYLYPAPDVSASGALQLRYSYLPAAFSCYSGLVTPPVPPAHDRLYQYGALYRAFLRSFGSPLAKDQATYYQGEYERARRKLYGQQITGPQRVRPGR
jgi:hypothetical protein